MDQTTTQGIALPLNKNNLHKFNWSKALPTSIAVSKMVKAGTDTVVMPRLINVWSLLRGVQNIGKKEKDEEKEREKEERKAEKKEKKKRFPTGSGLAGIRGFVG
ncbi:hypothetical protein RUND412_001313 [Rhizina undulata]